MVFKRLGIKVLMIMIILYGFDYDDYFTWEFMGVGLLLLSWDGYEIF